MDFKGTTDPSDGAYAMQTRDHYPQAHSFNHTGIVCMAVWQLRSVYPPTSTGAILLRRRLQRLQQQWMRCLEAAGSERQSWR